MQGERTHKAHAERRARRPTSMQAKAWGSVGVETERKGGRDLNLGGILLVAGEKGEEVSWEKKEKKARGIKVHERG